MAERRKDNKGRVLKNGEIQNADGSYRFKTSIEGKNIYLRSWRLIRSDVTPNGKKDTLCLRDQEKQLQWNVDQSIRFNGGGLTVFDLCQKYCLQKRGVKKNTKVGYQTVLNGLAKEEFSKRLISDISIMDAKDFLIKLQKDDKKSYSHIHTVRGVLRPAFQTAVEDDLIRKNPFEFPLADILVDDSIKKTALTRKQVRLFLDYVKNDSHFSNFYEGFYILFHTGMRISEFCGLTYSDIDLEQRTIRIERQLQYRGGNEYWIESTKTTCGERVFPIPKNDEELFRCCEYLKKIAKKRKEKPSVDKVKGFLYLSEAGRPMVGYQWSKKFSAVVTSYNKKYKEELPNITPHICRHTYCSLMIRSGANLKTVQKLMGHASIEVTMDIYTHVNMDDIREDVDGIDFDDVF